MIFFDIDGTLLDDKYAEQMGILEFLNQHRSLFSFSEDEFCQLWHTLAEKHFERYLSGELSFAQQRRDRIQELFRYVDQQLSDQQADEKFQVYLNHYENNWRVFPDTILCLNSLRGIPLGIVSNGSLEQQVCKLQKAGIYKQFTPVVVSEDLGVAKPNPAIFLEACRQAGRIPQECIYVGDRLTTDALASCAGGLRGVWLNRNCEAKKFSEVIAIHSLSELCSVIQEMSIEAL